MRTPVTEGQQKGEGRAVVEVVVTTETSTEKIRPLVTEVEVVAAGEFPPAAVPHQVAVVVGMSTVVVVQQ